MEWPCTQIATHAINFRYTRAEMPTPEVEVIVRDFVVRFVALVEMDVARRLQNVMASAVANAATAPTARSASATTKQPPVANTARRLAKASPKLARIRKLQGRYLGTMRRLKPAERARVKKVTHEKGVAAGLKLALSFR